MPKIDDLTIDPEFKALCDPLSPDEYNRLVEQIERDGYLDSLKAWSDGGKLLLIDGHTRYELWPEMKQKKLRPPMVDCLEFDSREDAVDWIIDHQLGRRNVSPQRWDYYVGKKYNRSKAKSDENLTPGPKSKSSTPIESPSRGQSGTSKKSGGKSSARQVSKETGASERTVKRKGEKAAAIDYIGEVNPKAKEDILSGTLKAKDKDLKAIGKLPKADVGKAVANLRNGRNWDHGLTPAHEPPRSNRRRRSKPKPEALKHLQAADKALGTLQDHITNASRCDPNGGIKPKPLKSHFESIYKAVNAAIQKLKK